MKYTDVTYFHLLLFKGRARKQMPTAIVVRLLAQIDSLKEKF